MILVFVLATKRGKIRRRHLLPLTSGRTVILLPVNPAESIW